MGVIQLFTYCLSSSTTFSYAQLVISGSQKYKPMLGPQLMQVLAGAGLAAASAQSCMTAYQIAQTTPDLLSAAEAMQVGAQLPCAYPCCNSTGRAASKL